MNDPMEVNGRLVNFPVHEAVLTGDVKFIQELLSDGYDVNSLHYDRVTPLHMACFGGNLETVLFLISRGAWINAQSIDNSTPLCDACAGGNVDCVKALLDAGACVNPPLCLSTPLHEASLRGNARVVSLLLSAGAKINLSDLHYGTPLHAVCSMRNPDIECIQLLIRAGARLNAIKIHKTPLHLIAEISQSIEAAELLFLYGANVYLQDGNGLKPRDLCPPASALASLLIFYESQPKSLLHCCRLVLRNHLGSLKIKHLSQLLSVPSTIVSLLQ